MLAAAGIICKHVSVSALSQIPATQSTVFDVMFFFFDGMCVAGSPRNSISTQMVCLS